MKTRSPEPIPHARNAISIASVPLATPIACATPTKSAKAASKTSTSRAEDIGAAIENAGDSGVDSGSLSEVSGAGVGLRDGEVGRLIVMGSQIVAREMTAIIFEGTAQPLGETDAGSPAGQSPETLVVDQEISDIDALALRRKLPDVVLAAAIRLDHRFCQSRQADRVAATDIERQPLGLRRERGGEERVRRVIDIEQGRGVARRPIPRTARPR